MNPPEVAELGPSVEKAAVAVDDRYNRACAAADVVMHINPSAVPEDKEVMVSLRAKAAAYLDSYLTLDGLMPLAAEPAPHG